MKKIITKKIIAILTIIVLIQPAYAAQKIRDMSMSVEETNELIDNPPVQLLQNNSSTGNSREGINAGTGFSDDVALDPNIARQMREINSRSQNTNKTDTKSILPSIAALPPVSRGSNKKNYINQFCNTPINNNPQSCQETQRQQACERFATATVTIQRILSQTIDCMINSTGIIDSECDGLDASRLDLLKQYWQDEDMAYTVLFLPDMVINIDANCARKR